MKEKLRDYALLAEIVSGIAIVVTLIFLVVETRENTNAIQVQTYQSLTAELNELRRATVTSEMMPIQIKIMESGYDSLTVLEWGKQMFWAEAKWGIYESAFYARERGILGDNEWLRFESAICRNLQGDHPLWYPDQGGPEFSLDMPDRNIVSNITPVFREYVESLCE